MADVFSVMDKSGKIIESSANPVKLTSLASNTLYSGMTAVRNYGTDKLDIPDQGTTPGAPSVSVSAGDGSATVSVTKSSEDGNIDISKATLMYKTVAGSAWTTLETDATLTAKISGLTDGTQYTVKSYLSNQFGDGDSSQETEFTPAAKVTVPDAPTLSVTAGDTQVSLNVTDPTNTGNAPVTSRTVYWTDGTNNGTVDFKSSTSGTATGLTNGTKYTFQATVTNSAGESAKSDPEIATPVAPTIAVTAISADKTATVETGKSGKLTVSVAPENATNKGFKVVSSDENVATVTSDGTYTGVEAGSATLTTTADADSSKTATTSLTVTTPVVPVTGITADSALSVKAGSTTKLTIAVQPSNATDKGYSITSTDESVATVTNDGTVTGVKAGTAEIDTVSHADATKIAKTTITVTAE